VLSLQVKLYHRYVCIWKNKVYTGFSAISGSRPPLSMEYIHHRLGDDSVFQKASTNLCNDFLKFPYICKLPWLLTNSCISHHVSTIIVSCRIALPCPKYPMLHPFNLTSKPLVTTDLFTISMSLSLSEK
jgi:hypothetical protein